mmetsp:Transcript_89351/g.239422  ORF Transcript_89351/g.239422 Transcript_89351/m.239422 type:complete len:275 (+) Transcript_89351:384-1208(+)
MLLDRVKLPPVLGVHVHELYDERMGGRRYHVPIPLDVLDQDVVVAWGGVLDLGVAVAYAPGEEDVHGDAQGVPVHRGGVGGGRPLPAPHKDLRGGVADGAHYRGRPRPVVVVILRQPEIRQFATVRGAENYVIRLQVPENNAVIMQELGPHNDVRAVPHHVLLREPGGVHGLLRELVPEGPAGGELHDQHVVLLGAEGVDEGDQEGVVQGAQHGVLRLQVLVEALVLVSAAVQELHGVVLSEGHALRLLEGSNLQHPAKRALPQLPHFLKLRSP